ncbi:hypothetical protein SAMN04488128_105104 [Chitinophaga eiseniae]|uniref:Uncharacterized protein n=1 Tax=Chitinophaga eiseniae TaxID=634771 RepID=A0A1T4TIE1_9BACT|nr:hypothetical protein [Chitinophaga eiseniae]SKA40031.1 hypothetical protein SAMN04488128_105104 [Chitinophaga eiseniae]
MKIILSAFIVILNYSSAVSQTIFKVVEAERNSFTGANLSDNMSRKYYRIVLVDDSLSQNFLYPLVIKKHNIDTVEAIRELLLLRGDTRMCSLPIMGYNPLKSQIYIGTNKNYSVQVEALFIINQLIFENPFYYSSYPVLVDKVDGSSASISGTVIDKAFEAYCSWYKKLKRIGIRQIKYKKIMPLDSAAVRWY